MTEESYQQCRKAMQHINYIRGQITKAKGNVSKWTKIEQSYREQLKQGSADGAAKALAGAMKCLQEQRDIFAAIKFPPDDLERPVVGPGKCIICGNVTPNNNQYCINCL